ncbi:hypothetical protein [Aquimarina brevivitae]|uniref:Sigma-70 family RNA polymerase sigma factor n=1 Tax=Aquimarina brevivitae TaxID=323412 RepID=A0A4Q7NYM5_9FLAO|nr:hypothetical protein [Aquimarina brevivitae]RZS92561.1 hypothetical protein EV197_2699 [Aquimarina brevivitae]
MKRINDLQKYFRVGQKDFNKRLLSVVPHLHPYIKHRLYIAEHTGILPRNMYCSNGIIDDAIVQLYDSNELIEDNLCSLELKLFSITDKIIDDLYAKEGWHQQSVSTNGILKAEMKQLEESYSVDADNEYIMNEELNDICYHQNKERKAPFIYDDTDSEILKIVAKTEPENRNKQRLLGKFYSWLPINTSKIIDLFVFGKLNFDEIATVVGATSQEVKETIITVRKSFRRNLV